MSIQVENIDTCTRTAIGELLLKADSNQLVKRVLTAFSISASKTAQLKSLSSFRLEFLEACAEFFGIALADGEDNKIFTKETIQSRILLAIKAHLPTTCSECAHFYRNPLDPEAEEQPSLYCHMCFQGSHDCTAIKSKVETLKQHNIVLPSGSVWLCHDCHKGSNPVVPRKSKSRHISISSTPTVSAPNSRAPSPQSRAGHQQEHHQDENEEEDELPVNVCEKYKVGKCPHGMRGNKIIDGAKCPKSHPKRCYKFCRNGKTGRYGCKKGDNCDFHHPVLCKYSVQKHLCTNAECTFVHLKGTKRKQSQAPQDMNSTIPASQQGRSRTLSQISRVQNVATSGHQATDSSINSSHFLELKNVVQLMSNNLQQQQQEMTLLRSNLMQFHQLQMQHPPIHPPPLPLNHPMNPQALYQHIPVQNHAVPSMIPPTMTFIPQSSC